MCIPVGTAKVQILRYGKVIPLNQRITHFSSLSHWEQIYQAPPEEFQGLISENLSGVVQVYSGISSQLYMLWKPPAEDIGGGTTWLLFGIKEVWLSSKLSSTSCLKGWDCKQRWMNIFAIVLSVKLSSIREVWSSSYFVETSTVMYC